MKRFSAVLVMLVLIFSSLIACSKGGAQSDGSKGKVTINALMMKQAGYSEDDINAVTKEFQAKNPNITVNLTFVPYEGLEQKILTSAKSGGYDVIVIDAPWTAKFAKAGIVRDVTDKLPKDARADIFDGALSAVEYNGKLYGLPWLNDALFLYYNKDMIKQAGFDAPPKTWEELIVQAKAIKDKKLVDYPIAWNLKQGENLMTVYVTLVGAFGGQIIDDKGNPTITQEGNKKALEFMVQSLKDGLSNPHSTEYLEEDVRGLYTSGKTAFCINWTYMYDFSNNPSQSQIVGKAGIAPAPGSGNIVSASTNGGMGLSITAGSKHVNEAWNYMEYLSSKDVQKRYAKNALPIWKSLYDDQKVIDTNPEVVRASKVQYNYLVNRPKVAWYGDLSTEMQVDVQKVLLGSMSVDDAIKTMQAKAEELSKK